MAMIRKVRKASKNPYEVRITKEGVLPKPVYEYFSDEVAAKAFAARMEAQLAAGKIPDELRQGQFETLGELIRHYQYSVSSFELQYVGRSAIEKVTQVFP